VNPSAPTCSGNILKGTSTPKAQSSQTPVIKIRFPHRNIHNQLGASTGYIPRGHDASKNCYQGLHRAIASVRVRGGLRNSSRNRNSPPHTTTVVDPARALLHKLVACERSVSMHLSRSPLANSPDPIPLCTFAHMVKTFRKHREMVRSKRHVQHAIHASSFCGSSLFVSSPFTLVAWPSKFATAVCYRVSHCTSNAHQTICDNNGRPLLP